MSAGGFRHPDYEVFGELGRGAFGTVYRARRKGMQDCAVKVFDPGRVDLARAARELEKLQRVQEHRGVVTVYDFDLSGEAPFYAMGLHAERDADGVWRGRTLAGLCGKVPEKEAWRLIGDIAEALAYLHEHEVIHCDVKPGNVLLTDERPAGVKVCDFGQSRGSAGQWGERAGTVGYAAPEQLEKPGDSGEGKGYRWDVYAFGVTAYELLTGKWPRLEGVRTESAGDAATLREGLAGASLHEAGEGGMVAEVVARLRAEGDAVRWSAGAKLDRELCAVIERCLVMDPTKRFGDMRAVAEALRAVETRRALERSRRILATVCGLALLAVLGGVGAMWQWREAERAHQRTHASLSRAEVLVDFMTSEMRSKLQPLGKLDLMGALVKAIEEYHLDRDRAEAEGRERRSSEEIIRRAMSLRNAAGLLNVQGDADGALRMFHMARDLLLGVRGKYEVSRELSGVNAAISNVLFKKGEGPSAVCFAQEAIACGESFAARHPDDVEVQGELVGYRKSLAGNLRAAGRLDEAAAVLTAARADLDRLIERNPEQTAWRVALSRIHEEQAEDQRLRGDASGARTSMLRAVEITEALAAEAPQDADRQADSGRSLGRLASMMQANRDLDGAASVVERAIAAWEKLVAQDKSNTDWLGYLAGALYTSARVELDRGRIESALATSRRLLRIREDLVAGDPANRVWQRTLAQAWLRMAQVQIAKGECAGALESICRAEDILDRLLSVDAGNAEWKYELFRAVDLKGTILNRLGQTADALAAYRRSREILRAMVAAHGTRPTWDDDIKRIEEAIRGLEAARVP